MSNRDKKETKLNLLSAFSSKDSSRYIKNQQNFEKSPSDSSLESDRFIQRRGSAPRSSFLISIEKELQKLNSQIHISTHSDLVSSIQNLVTNILLGTFPCNSCNERIETIENLTNMLQVQKITAIDEIDKVREMKAQVKKYENLLRNKEKNLDMQRTNLAENSELVERKAKMLEQNMRNLENERKKLKDERKKLDDDKSSFIRQYKKLDDQFMNANKEIGSMNPPESQRSIQKEKEELALKTEMLNTLAAEVNNKQKLMIEVVEKFAEMKGRLEESHKNLENLIRDKLINSNKSDEANKTKVKKLKTQVKRLESRLIEILSRQQENSFSKEDLTERFHSSQKNQELEEKDLKILEYKKKCERLEESLLQKNLKIQELTSVPDDVYERAKEYEMKEKELQELEENLGKEREEIAKTAEMLQEVYLQLEIQQKTLNLEKQLVESEHETNEKFFEKESKAFDCKGENRFAVPSLPLLALKESIHFSDDDMIIRINK